MITKQCPVMSDLAAHLKSQDHSDAMQEAVNSKADIMLDDEKSSYVMADEFLSWEVPRALESVAYDELMAFIRTNLLRAAFDRDASLSAYPALGESVRKFIEKEAKEQMKKESQ